VKGLIIKSSSKKVFGTVDLFNSIPLDMEKFELWKDRHKLNITYYLWGIT